jgi:hypothetical protein
VIVSPRDCQSAISIGAFHAIELLAGINKHWVFWFRVRHFILAIRDETIAPM